MLCFTGFAPVRGESLRLGHRPVFAFCFAGLACLRGDLLMACGKQGIAAGECDNSRGKQVRRGVPPQFVFGKARPAPENSTSASG